MIRASTALCFGSIGTRCFTIFMEFHHDACRVQEDILRWTARITSKVDSTLMHSCVIYSGWELSCFDDLWTRNINTKANLVEHRVKVVAFWKAIQKRRKRRMVIRRKKKKVKENRTGEKNQEDRAVREHILCGDVIYHGTNMCKQHERWLFCHYDDSAKAKRCYCIFIFFPDH